MLIIPRGQDILPPDILRAQHTCNLRLALQRVFLSLSMSRRYRRNVTQPPCTLSTKSALGDR
jgi:hypothetical protein